MFDLLRERFWEKFISDFCFFNCEVRVRVFNLGGAIGSFFNTFLGGFNFCSWREFLTTYSPNFEGRNCGRRIFNSLYLHFLGGGVPFLPVLSFLSRVIKKQTKKSEVSMLSADSYADSCLDMQIPNIYMGCDGSIFTLPVDP